MGYYGNGVGTAMPFHASTLPELPSASRTGTVQSDDAAHNTGNQVPNAQRAHYPNTMCNAQRRPAWAYRDPAPVNYLAPEPLPQFLFKESDFHVYDVPAQNDPRRGTLRLTEEQYNVFVQTHLTIGNVYLRELMLRLVPDQLVQMVSDRKLSEHVQILAAVFRDPYLKNTGPVTFAEAGLHTDVEISVKNLVQRGSEELSAEDYSNLMSKGERLADNRMSALTGKLSNRQLKLISMDKRLHQRVIQAVETELEGRKIVNKALKAVQRS